MPKAHYQEFLARSFVFDKLPRAGAKTKSENLGLLFPRATVTPEEFTSIMQQLVPPEYYRTCTSAGIFFATILENLFGQVPMCIPVQVFASKWMGREYSLRTTKAYRRKTNKPPSTRCLLCGQKTPKRISNVEETMSEQTA